MQRLLHTYVLRAACCMTSNNDWDRATPTIREEAIPILERCGQPNKVYRFLRGDIFWVATVSCAVCVTDCCNNHYSVGRWCCAETTAAVLAVPMLHRAVWNTRST